jgi:hypothetical protein
MDADDILITGYRCDASKFSHHPATVHDPSLTLLISPRFLLVTFHHLHFLSQAQFANRETTTPATLIAKGTKPILRLHIIFRQWLNIGYRASIV